MNSIRRPRLRPRARSVNFRSFAWLVQREAALHVIHPAIFDAAGERKSRGKINRWRTAAVTRLVRNLLALYPERRWWYGRNRVGW